MKKRLMAFVIVIGLTFLLSGCSSEAIVKNEDEMLRDIMVYDDCYSSHNLEITEFNVVSRLTSTEERIDEITVEISAKNEDFTYTATYGLSYKLWDDGWSYDQCHLIRSDYNASRLVSETEAEEAILMRGEYTDLKFDHRDDSQNYSDFMFYGYKIEGYMGTYCQINAKFRFTLVDGWSCFDVEETSVDGYPRSWEIGGEWLYDDGTNRIWINIVDIDESQNTVSMEYAMEYYEATWESDVNEVYSSGGVVTLPYRELVNPYYLTIDIPEDGLEGTLWIENKGEVRFHGFVLTQQ